MPLTVVVAALGEELAPLAERLVGRRRVTGGRCEEGRLGRWPVRLVWTGTGGANARTGLRRLLAERGVRDRRLVLAGIAGGLDPALTLGDVVHLERALKIEGDGAPEERPIVVSGHRGRAGVTVTVDRIVASAAEKRALWERLGCPPSAVVDMETFHWLAELDANAPVSVLRVVSDPAGTSLPAFLARSIGAGGEVSRWKVAARALPRPDRIAALLRLRRDVRCAAERLADALEVVVREAGS